MIKRRALLLHGTDGSPDYNWFPWLRSQLEMRGYDVYCPLLPENHTPNSQVYDEFLRNSGWDFRGNIIIGHSSGATTALNLLNADWFPAQRRVILVGTFLNERLLPGIEWYEPGQFDGLFPESGFGEYIIKQKSDSFVFIHGHNDPYCSVKDAVDLANKLGGDMVVVEDGLHLSSNRRELPEILPFI